MRSPRSSRRQVDTGIDVVSDGEISKISYATYIARPLRGLRRRHAARAGPGPGRVPALHGKARRRAGATAKYRRPRCIGEIARQGPRAAARGSRATCRAAVDAAKPVEAFMNAASPGVIALFQPNDYYKTQDAYLEALGRTRCGRVRGDRRRGLPAADRRARPRHGPSHDVPRTRARRVPRALAARHVEVLNHALRNVPAERVAHARLLGQLRGAAPPRRAARAAAAGRDRGEAAGRCSSKRRIRGTRTNGPCSGKQKVPDDKILDARRPRHDDELHRASGARGRAHPAASPTSSAASASWPARTADSGLSAASARWTRTSST